MVFFTELFLLFNSYSGFIVCFLKVLETIRWHNELFFPPGCPTTSDLYLCLEIIETLFWYGFKQNAELSDFKQLWDLKSVE